MNASVSRPLRSCLCALFPARMVMPAAIVGALALITFIAPATASITPASDPLAGRRPNIILIMTDDQGYGELSSHGNPILQTPHLDRLHAQSARFIDFSVSPTCAPTRAALLTGRHEFRSGITHTILERERLSPNAVTLPQILQSAGYRTGIFGKWHLGDERDRLPNRRGFDEMFIHGGGGIGQTYPGSCGDAPGNSYFNPAILHNGRFVQTEGYCTDVFFRQALSWIDHQRHSGRPFFAYITPNAPHAPLVSPGPDYDRLLENRGLDQYGLPYYSMIRNIDDNVGRLLDQIHAWGLDESTLIIFLTDNGHSIGHLYNAGMRAAKGSPYQGGIRVPSFWRWPTHIPPGDRPQTAAHLDVFPTLAELASAQLPSRVRHDLEGHSLVPCLENPAAPWPERTLVTHVGRWPTGRSADWKHRGTAIRHGPYKLVNHSELYHLESDPAESRNLAATHPDIVETLRARFDAWWDDVLPAALENEMARGPRINPFKARYWRQFGGGPDAALLDQMNPALKFRGSDSADRPPNIIFMLADDLGYGDLGAFGQTRIRTPHLDRLAADGMRLTRHYAGNAVCAPSRCVLLTGLHPGHAFIRNNREVQPEGQWPLPPDAVTLPRRLKNLGYGTGAFGKWGLGSPGSPGDPLRQGFDRFFGYNCQRAAHNAYPTSLWNNAKSIPLNNPPFPAHQRFPEGADPNRPESYAAYSGNDYAPDRITDEALQFIRNHRNTPFFLYYPTIVPHLALQVPADSLAEYQGAFPDSPYLGQTAYLPHPTPRAAYAAMISRLDQAVGRIVQLVRELNLEEHTLFVFTSDNGPLYDRLGGTDSDFFNSAAGLRGRKGSLYEGGVRVPCIVSWKGRIAPGSASDLVSGFEDWLPTLLELAGGHPDPQGTFDGRSVAPTLLGKSQTQRPLLYREFPGYGGWQSVTIGPWKLLRHGLQPNRDSTPQPTLELFNLDRDPAESRNLADSHPRRVARMLRAAMREHVPNAHFPMPLLDAPHPALP